MRNGNEWTEEIRNEAEKILGYRFKNAELLKICFTHKSYSNAYGGKNNERLEFLGDAVLELCVSEQLFKRMNCDEGKLTELRQRYVNKDALETAAKRAGLMRLMRFSGGEENIRGKTASNLFEAVIAGLYLDGGMRPVMAFLEKYLTEDDTINYKTLLQEYVQAKIKRKPEYSKACPRADGKYFCTVSALGKKGEGIGESIKEAETVAAESLYHNLIKGNQL